MVNKVRPIWRIMSVTLIAGLACVASLPAGRAAGPQSQPSSAPSPQQLEQARAVFRQIMGGGLTEADKARVEKLIAQLGSDKWRDREEAQKALLNEGPAALPLVGKAVESNDPEVATRARTIVAALEARSTDHPLSLRSALVTRQAARDTAVVGDLIALLDSGDRTVRSTAQWGVGCLSLQDFGYVASDEPNQRRQAAGKAREWWEKSKASFQFGADLYAVLDLGGEIKLEAVLIPAGKFLMGSRDGEDDSSDPQFRDESPRHEVTITKAFYMGVCAVTQEQYERITGGNPSLSKGARIAVDQVSWDSAVEFCKTISRKTGKTVRLPTEAEWEYACRAGGATRYCFGDDADGARLTEYAWYTGNSGSAYHPVGLKKPNDWGLYDVHGNAWQWCADWFGPYEKEAQRDPTGPASGVHRIARGASANDGPLNCRSARRGRRAPDDWIKGLGFRVAVDVK